MAVELGYAAEQTVQPGAGAILETIRGCMKCPKNVLHENMSPNVTLRGIVRNPCCNASAQYEVSFSGNIAVPADGTVGEIQLALSVNGYVRPLTIATATPTVADAFWHVSGDTTVDVPAGCCMDVAVVNASVSATPATMPAPAVAIRNLNVKINRVA